MRISKLRIENYRNLDGVAISFDEDVTYIVGENNLGKTNVLDLLNTIFNQATIGEEDFADTEKRSGAVVTLKMDEDEIGISGPDIDPTTGNTITVCAFADDPDSRIEFVAEESGEKISPSFMRSVHMFRYSTASFNRGDLAFDGTRGVGKVLSKGIALYLDREGKEVSDFLDGNELEGLVADLGTIVGDVPILSSYGVRTGVDSSDGGTLGSLVTLLDNRGVHFKKAGVGLQYLAIASLSIIESIMRLSPKRLQESLCSDGDDKRVLHAVLVYDEPEAHLHPYMQRRLSKSLHRICEGEDAKFNALLKEYFGIDSIKAQLIMVTHSPNILARGYKNIVRFGQGEDSPRVMCGKDIDLSDKIEKHLMLNFESIREAFFARSVLAFEGQTESGAIPVFACNLGIDLDDYGVVPIRAGGKENVKPLGELLDKFKIPNYSIVDRDAELPETSGDHITTIERDFEAEVIDSFFASDNQGAFIALLESTNSQRATSIKGNSNALIKASTIYDVCLPDSEYDFQGPEFDGQFADTPKSRALMYAWLSSNKGVVSGVALAEALGADGVPVCYESIIRKAVGLEC
ncbi:ATP-dependent nuclease [Veillonella atypica]|uniref:ATP-dependent nuclease n=1 Tax=Veillonella atypica TaxID=39777 RepID=UPI003AF77802